MAGSQSFLSQFIIKIGGEDLPEEIQDSLLEVVVDTTLYLPEMFTILIRDPELKWVDNTKFFDLGKPVEISAQAGEDLGGESGSLMKGEITALEPNFSGQGETTFLVRGYSKAHRLHRGKISKTFLNQSDTDIVKKIAGEVGLSPTVDPTPGRHDYVVQNNQTNFEFLQSRAARLGYKVFATSDELYFKKGEATLGDGPELVLGEILRDFRPYLSTTHQVDKVTVLGWDAKQKKEIKGEASPNSSLNQGGVGKTGGSVAGVFGAAEMVLVNQPVMTPDEAKALAQGVADDISSEFMRADGVCFGHPKVKAGYTITVANIGKRFSGKYFITSATHIVNRDGYETHFTISGRQPNTLSQLLAPSNGASSNGPGQSDSDKTQGVAVGIVTNNSDPDDLGRVKVKFPWLGTDIESDWIRIASPGAGQERGLSYLPEIDDEVLVSFEHGNTRYPYVLGGLWNSKDKPPAPNSQAISGGKVNQRIIKTRKGHIILLDDEDGKEQIAIVDQSGSNSVVISSEHNSVTVEGSQGVTLQSGSQKVVIDGQGNKIQLSGGGRMVTMSNGQVEVT